jgi:hypothetical protein
MGILNEFDEYNLKNSEKYNLKTHLLNYFSDGKKIILTLKW